MDYSKNRSVSQLRLCAPRSGASQNPFLQLTVEETRRSPSLQLIQTLRELSDVKLALDEV